MGLILDTTEFVIVERAGGSVRDIVERFGVNQFSGVSVITIAELRYGLHRADTDRRKNQRAAFLNDVLKTFQILPVTTEVAIRVGDLNFLLESLGQKLAFPDLIIAATALEWNCAVATRNDDHFRRIPGLTLYHPE